jgi:hypothetical protein
LSKLCFRQLICKTCVSLETAIASFAAFIFAVASEAAGGYCCCGGGGGIVCRCLCGIGKCPGFGCNSVQKVCPSIVVRLKVLRKVVPVMFEVVVRLESKGVI